MRTTFDVAAPPEAWSRMADPAALAAALPGARRVSADGDGTLSVTADVAVASVTGLWSGTVTPVDADAVRIAGAGTAGRLDLEVRASPDRSRLTVEGEVDGPLATVGGAVLAAAARRLAVDLLEGLADPGAGEATPFRRPSALTFRLRDARTGVVTVAAVVVAVVMVAAIRRWRRGSR